MTWDQNHWLEDFKGFPKCPRTWSYDQNRASCALEKLGKFHEFAKVNFAQNTFFLLMGLKSLFETSPITYARPTKLNWIYFLKFID